MQHVRRDRSPCRGTRERSVAPLSCMRCMCAKACTHAWHVMLHARSTDARGASRMLASCAALLFAIAIDVHSTRSHARGHMRAHATQHAMTSANGTHNAHPCTVTLLARRRGLRDDTRAHDRCKNAWRAAAALFLHCSPIASVNIAHAIVPMNTRRYLCRTHTLASMCTLRCIASTELHVHNMTNNASSCKVAQSVCVASHALKMHALHVPD